jgi:hypothetical protein
VAPQVSEIVLVEEPLICLKSEIGQFYLASLVGKIAVPAVINAVIAWACAKYSDAFAGIAAALFAPFLFFLLPLPIELNYSSLSACDAPPRRRRN